MFKNLLKTARPLVLVSLLVLAVLAILTLGPVPTYTDFIDVSTYYEGSTTVINGTALNSTGNLDANDGIYYAVNSATATITQSQTLTYSGTVDAGGWLNVPNIDADDTSYASATARNKVYWVDIDNHTISGTITSVVIKIDCWTNVDETKEFTLGFSKDGSTTNLATYDINSGTSEATYSWDITSYISNWTEIDKLRLSVKSIDPGSPNIGFWYVDYHRVEVKATTYFYEVDVRHTSEQVVEPIASITQIFLQDNFKFNTTVTAHLEWFNWTANAWTNINSGSVGTTEVAWSKNWTSRFSDVINSTGYMKVRIYTSNESTPHRLLEDYLHWDITYQVPDITPPTWSNAGTNNTVAGLPTLFHVKWTDNVNMSGYIFGTNNTGTWQNDTWTAWSPPGTPKWSNVTKILNSTSGMLIQWRVWANDTSNNWNDTGILLLTPLQPPHAEFTYSPLTPYTGENVTFNATSSYDPDGIIVSYVWDFGDNTTGTGNVTTHSYADDGTYTVTLNVTDDDGLSDTTSANVTVLNRSPVANFTESAETFDTGEIIYFNATQSSDPDGTIVTYFWDFGDGANATGVTVDYSYTDDGTYTVTLTVTDDDGATDTANSTKTVLNRPPVALFTENATVVLTGEAISFNASSSYDPDGTIVSYFWDFGDGTNATGVTATHSYPAVGTYTVTLTVTDDDGATGSANATKTVSENLPPVALFTENATIVFIGEVILFNASASYDPDGTVVSYFWDFGDGTNATGVVTSHSYADNGSYTVTLIVTDDNGATDNATAIKTVLNRLPVAIFTESAETVYTGETIYFNASDSYDPDGTIAIYFWDFGDETNASGVTTSHSYADDGNYTVTLTVTDTDGATGSTNAIKIILNRSPVASFTESAETVYTWETISFNASLSYDPDGTISSFFWDFGDGTNATGVTVNHSYVDNGNYIVTLTVTDNDGAIASTNATKTVLNRPPIANFTESTETAYVGEPITFNATDSYDADGTIVSYFWDFGDGTNTTGVIVDHSYTNNGTYTVTLTVIDDDGATDSVNATKTILLNEPPVALFTESAETVYTSETIYFNASDSYDPDGTIISYEWDFGDGTNGTGIASNHTYTDDGIYIVVLTVTDDRGALGTANATKTVLNRPPIAAFTENATTVLTGEVIRFNASSSYDPDGYIATYFWDFGDGTNASGLIVSHFYVDDGNYTVTLTVTDDDGATDSANATKTVLNRSPVAIFTESAESVFVNETISFNASASYDSDGTIVSYFWDFGDGTNATGVTTTHFYTAVGTYTVTLTVTDDDGATSSANATKTVSENVPPVALFAENATVVLTGESILFNASSSSDPDGSIAIYFWDFGDGTNATGVTVSHSYADDGTYTVTLTVTDDDGATASANATKTVLNRPPIASFTEDATTVLTGEVIHFDASGSSDPDGVVVSYFWAFGDGTNATGVTVDHSYADNGNYTVTLTVTDDDGATDTADSIKHVLNRPPVAIFTESAETVETGEVIYFNASLSYDPDGFIVNYTWNFSDGVVTTVDVPTITHSYADDGTYTVTLTVTDDDGATDTTTSNKTVLNRPPVADADGPYSGFESSPITFDASGSTDVDGAIVLYEWDWDNNGIYDESTISPFINHTWFDDFSGTVGLRVRDEEGLTGTATALVTVQNVAPTVEAGPNQMADEGSPISFSGSFTDPSASDTHIYFWDFGDGSNASDTLTPTHYYADNNIYTVTLTVTDDDGGVGTDTLTVTVNNVAPTVEAGSDKTGNEGDAVSFSGFFTDPGADDTHTIFWDFGDGTYTIGTLIPTHVYGDNGVYTVTLTVTDDDGGFGVDTLTVTVYNVAPTVYAGPDQTVFLGQTVIFSGSFTDPGTKDTHTYFWGFGDGTNASGTLMPTHVYTAAGNYTVTLTVTDDDGGFGVDTLAVNVFEAEFNDVAVIDVALSASEAYWTWTIQINVTVINKGAGTASFNVAAYFSNPFSWYQIGTLTVTNLGASENTTVTFKWNLAGLTEGASYPVKANATLLYGIDVNPADNEKVDGQVKVRLWGDVDGNGVISILDLKKVKLAYSKLIVEPLADLDGNGLINVLDVKKMKLIYSGAL